MAGVNNNQTSSMATNTLQHPSHEHPLVPWDFSIDSIIPPCIQDLYYADGTKAPRVYHGHQLETFVAEDTGSSTCATCGSQDASGEFIGCASCQVFIHRDCVQVPEILQYPHHPDHTLILFLNRPDHHELRCRSCSSYLVGELTYHCTSCNFFLHVLCALKTLSYCKEGIRMKYKGIWHEHPLLLCHRTGSVSGRCFNCDDESTGSMYACEVQDCGFLLHPRCIVTEPTIIHPHHPEHRLTVFMEADGPPPLCEACRGEILGLHFSCKLCAFYLHDECVTRLPTWKHYLHEHELLRLDNVPSLECNRCCTSTDSPFFRCVPCNFNLHEKCMDLPRVVNCEVHWHPLTMHESYVEDDSGEYYCDHCEKRRDERLGVYVCGQCTARWAYHIECVMPELRKVCAKADNAAAIKRLADEIARGEEEVRETERKLDEMKLELDEKRKKHAALILD